MTDIIAWLFVLWILFFVIVVPAIGAVWLTSKFVALFNIGGPYGRRRY